MKIIGINLYIRAGASVHMNMRPPELWDQGGEKGQAQREGGRGERRKGREGERERGREGRRESYD